MARAIDLLPPQLKPFYEKNRDEIVARSVDPDLWRNVGWEDDPNHFVNFGVREYGEFPFVALPRDLESAIDKWHRDAEAQRHAAVARARALRGSAPHLRGVQ